jgi:hypothetical protein
MNSRVVVVGAGIAGLTVAEGLLKKGYKDVTILEKYPNVGGRIVTNRENGLQYEIGAGRIYDKHMRVAKLVKRFGLHKYPISSDVEWRSVQSPAHGIPNDFEKLMDLAIPVLEALPTSKLAEHTISELLPPSWKEALIQYPYWAELNLMRADAAIKSFKQEMSSYKGFYGIVEGIDAITTNLMQAVIKAGGVIQTRVRIHDIKKGRDGVFEIVGDSGKKVEAKPFYMTADKVIIATCRCSLSLFSVLKGHAMLDQLQTSPLIRIYAVYPPGKNGHVWFESLNKTVTDSPLRFVIPIDSKKGLIMISYTDGEDTNKWKNLEDKELKIEIQKEVKRLFSEWAETPIPEPTYLQKHVWSGGCTYWTPGKYKISQAVKQAMQPTKNLFVVGESVSESHQAWIEGALESAERLLTLFK